MRRLRVAITGISGQLGRALRERFAADWDISGVSSAQCDVRDWRAVREWIAAARPDIVIHAAAATNVDGCERDPDHAFAVNALGTRNVARSAAQVGADLVYMSTNYVFDGQKPEPYHEFDDPAPLSVYGHSKLAGEREALAATARCYVIRTAMVYAREGSNFVNTMFRLMERDQPLRVVSDQVGNPTYAPDLAEAIGWIIQRGPCGVYHVTNRETASWYDWAVEIASLTGSCADVQPIPGSAYQRAARPPDNGALVSLALPDLQIELPDWRDALRRCLVAR